MGQRTWIGRLMPFVVKLVARGACMDSLLSCWLLDNSLHLPQAVPGIVPLPKLYDVVNVFKGAFAWMS